MRQKPPRRGTIVVERTARARTPVAVRERKEGDERPFQHAPLPTFTWQWRGQDFLLLEGNAAAQRVTQGRLQQMVGVTVTEFYRDQPTLLAAFRRCFRERQALTLEGEHRLQSTGTGTGETPNGVTTFVYVPPDLVMVGVLDLTDRHAQETAAREQARLNGALLVARTAAHEINNALSPVAGYADLLTLHPAVQDDPVLGSYARLISDAAHEAAAKVRQLQSMVRLHETTALSGPDTPLLDLAASSAV